MFVLSIHRKSGHVSLFLRTFASRLDENGLCAIGTLTTRDNKNAMAYADNCVVEGVALRCLLPPFLSVMVICSESKGFHQPKG